MPELGFRVLLASDAEAREGYVAGPLYRVLDRHQGLKRQNVLTRGSASG